MPDASYPLPFTFEDLQPRDLEPLSRQLRCSLGFVRLCLCAGCPTRKGRLSAAELLHWLFENYPAVRALAGLPALSPLEVLPPEIHVRHQMAHAIITLADFGMSRSSYLSEKHHLEGIRRTLLTAIMRDS